MPFKRWLQLFDATQGRHLLENICTGFEALNRDVDKI
jgi:hypothetical protein